MVDTNPHKNMYKYGSYGVWVITFILICCVLCNRKNIAIGVAVMKCTGVYIGNNPHVFLVPPLSITLLMGICIIEVSIGLYVISVGTIGPNPNLPIVTTVKWTKETEYVFLYSLFGDLWINAFIIGCT